MGQAERRVSEVAAVRPAGSLVGPSGSAVGLAGSLGEPAESIGAYLARERRLRGIDLEELSRATRIPVRSLQRLESGAFDGDPDGFVRGFVRTVAGALGLPADETIARMLPEASEEERRAARRFGRRALAALALAMFAGLGAALWLAARHGVVHGGSPLQRDAVVHRRDAVRELAAARGLLGGTDASTGLAAPPASIDDPGREPAPAKPPAVTPSRQDRLERPRSAPHR